jgi:hypothetical protein
MKGTMLNLAKQENMMFPVLIFLGGAGGHFAVMSMKEDGSYDVIAEDTMPAEGVATCSMLIDATGRAATGRLLTGDKVIPFPKRGET